MEIREITKKLYTYNHLREKTENSVVGPRHEKRRNQCEVWPVRVSIEWQSTDRRPGGKPKKRLMDTTKLVESKSNRL